MCSLKKKQISIGYWLADPKLNSLVPTCSLSFNLSFYLFLTIAEPRSKPNTRIDKPFGLLFLSRPKMAVFGSFESCK